MALSNYLVGELLTEYFAGKTHYLSLHVTDPTTAGLADTELSPATVANYARKPTGWSAAANRGVYNTLQLSWLGMPVVSVGYLGVWDAPIGGQLLAVLRCADRPLEVPSSGGAILLPIGSIGIVLGGSPEGRASLIETSVPALA